MRRGSWLLLLAGCGPASPEAGRVTCAYQTTGFVANVRADLEAGKHLRDAERFENASMEEHAEREYWFAELKLLGATDPRLSRRAPQVRNARLALRDRRRGNGAPLVAVKIDADPSPVDWGTRPLCGLKIPQADLEITKHVRDGERFMNGGRCGDAAREFELAERKILGPGASRAMTDLLPHVREARRRLHECRSP